MDYICFPHLLNVIWALNKILVKQPREIDTQPYQMAKKEHNGAAYCKEDVVTEDKETQSDRALTEEDCLETRTDLPSCQLTAHMVQETALWSSFPLHITHTRHTYTLSPPAAVLSSVLGMYWSKRPNIDVKPITLNVLRVCGTSFLCFKMS